MEGTMLTMHSTIAGHEMYKLTRIWLKLPIHIKNETSTTIAIWCQIMSFRKDNTIQTKLFDTYRDEHGRAFCNMA